MRTILITGGAGFIGSCLVRRVVGEGRHRVVNLDKLTYAGNLDSLEPVAGDANHLLVQGDIGDRELVGRLLAEHRPWAIVNFAAESHVDRSIDGPAEFVETNVLASFRLLEVALRHWQQLEAHEAKDFRFLHVSTDEVFGSLGASGSFVETTPYAPNSPYSASKAAFDHFVRAYHHTFGLPTLVTNSSNNYGPFQFPEKLIPLMITSAIAGKPLPVYGDGQQVRDWLHVEDHCRAIRRVLKGAPPGATYNVGGGCERTNLAIVEAICQAVDRRAPKLSQGPRASLVTFVADRPGHDRRYAIDAGKIRRELGWRPLMDFESGLESTVDWYFANRTWINRIATGVYRGERLGLLRTSA
jgi:dTDP-glucose 4,6-dehydratase